jgi:glycosyltransferase involved in cell wall biosynthesis
VARVLTWPVHGNYLLYLAHAPHEFVVPVRPDRSGSYGGLGDGFPWPDNLLEVPADELRGLELDAVLFQAREHYLGDRRTLLSTSQQLLPAVYVEHDPPREHPTDLRHVVDDPEALLVHVTPFNQLMWDSGRTPTTVVEHGVPIPPEPTYTGELERGLVIVNNLASRGRRLGADVFERVRREVPLDLVGLGSEAIGGLGPVSYEDLPALAGRYRFVFNPIRYTSLGLAICEAMACGLPIVGLATTEMATAVENGVSGYVDTRFDRLIDRMRALLADRDEARDLGRGARRRAQERFSLGRFAADWDAVLSAACR